MTPDSVGGITAASKLRRSLRRLAIATVILYLALIAAGVKVYSDSKNTSDALCTFRQDLVTRVLASTDFLRDHPKGIPGIPPKFILESIANQQRTITSLKDLHCPTSGPTPPPPKAVPEENK